MIPTPQTKKEELKLNKGLGELTVNEINLIKIIRERFRFGDITIITHDGQPKKVKQVTEYEALETYPQRVV